jgi:hypothetical protein
MIQDHRPHALACDVFLDGFREQSGYILVRLGGECLEFVPGGLVDLRADLDVLPGLRMVDEPEMSSQPDFAPSGRRSAGNCFGIFTGHGPARLCTVMQSRQRTPHFIACKTAR